MNICYEIDREANRLTAWSRLAALSISYPLGLARSLSFLLRRVIRRHTGVELGYRRRQVA
jgi:hypothetical protein